MRSVRVAFLAFLLAIRAAYAEDPAAPLGRDRALRSIVEWEIRDAGHPTLGNIRYAYIKRPVETKAGKTTVYSRAYFSCQRERRMFAIELANAIAPADPGGLQPASDPRLVCNRPTKPGDARLVQEELLASWEVNEKIGDALARGLRAFPLRECVSIGVQQEVTLPPGADAKTARIQFELLPYDRMIDAIFMACGEVSAYGPAPVAPAATSVATARAPAAAPTPPTSPSAAPVAAPRIAAATPAPSPTTDASWRSARAIPAGMTNVRSAPSLQSSIVVQLHPGAVVQVQRASSDWWRARTKTPKGVAVEGFIREDRLTFR